jgi:ribosome-associated heat shock protein Hsp15
MATEPPSRLDQWLWGVRVFRTRTLAAAAVKEGRVQVDGKRSKPAHEVRPGQLIQVRLGQGASAWMRTLKAIGSPPSRVGAPLVAQFAEDLTPAEEIEKSKVREPFIPGFRPRGTGRPTKRERREIDDMQL